MAEINTTNNNIESNDVVAISESLTSGDSFAYVDFGARVFEANNLPVVSATLFNSGANEPILGAMISEISTTGVVVVFSDDLPSANYELKILASI